MKTLSILGSTGSIGTQTLDVVRANPDYAVAALAAGRNVTLLEAQAREFHPQLVSCASESDARDLRVRLADTGIRVVSGEEGVEECARIPAADVVCGAMVGMQGIRPAIAAIEAGKDLALANKETLVAAGHIIMKLAAEKGVKILPVDSEHSAVFQCLNGERRADIDKLIITASGGPFRGKKRDELRHVTAAEALKHPNWSMGPKVTIDSSTLANKGLEVMEAHWLFGVDYGHIQVVVQPKSLVHSMVQFVDGAIMAQFGTPDMKLMIQYALTWPERRYLAGERLDLAKIGQITFEEPDIETFPALALAFRAGREGGVMPAVFNAANECAVPAFLAGKIAYLDIPDMIARAMDTIKNRPEPTLDEVFEAEKEVRELLS